MKVITIEIDEDGNQTVDLKGYFGRGCAAVQAVFERAIGKSIKVTRKPEYNAVTTNNKQVTR